MLWRSKNDIAFDIDPHNKFSYEDRGINMTDALTMCGLIPLWLTLESNRGLTAKEVFEKEYKFGVFEITGGNVKKDGKYSYPGDPTFYPLLKIKRDNEIIYQYQSGIVSIIKEDETTFVTRLD